MTLGTGILVSANSFHGQQHRALRAIHVRSVYHPGLLPECSTAPPGLLLCHGAQRSMSL